MGFGLVNKWVGQGFVYVTGGDMACVTVYNEFVVLAGSGSLIGFNLSSLF